HRRGEAEPLRLAAPGRHEEGRDERDKGPPEQRGLCAADREQRRPDKERGVRDAIDRRVEERTKRRAATRRLRDLPVERVGERPEDQDDERELWHREREEERADDREPSADQRDGVRGHAKGRKPARDG